MVDIQNKEIAEVEGLFKDGTIAIVGGEVKIKDPQPGGRGAMIHPHPNVVIKVNGIEITRPCKLTSQDQVEIIPGIIHGKRILNVRTDQEKIHAYATIHYQPSENIMILDCAASRELMPQVKITEEQPKAYTVSEILEELKEAKIVYGIDKEAINKLIKQPEKEILIARGKEVQKGTDGYIEYLFYSKQQEKNLQDINTRVDFKALKEIPSVKKGDIIARRTPPIPGKEGMDIYGNPIKVPNIKDPIFTAGNNVEVGQDGLQAITLVDGKPTLKGNVLQVFSLHEVFGDVDIKSGNIDFFGDVVIKGNVKEGMRVKAGHNIEIYGSISGTHLEAGGEIQIKNWAFQSTIIAGASQAMLQEVYNHISTLQGLMVRLLKGSMEVTKKLSTAATSPPLGKIVALVMEKHFKEIPVVLKSLKSLNKNKTLPFLDEKSCQSIQYLANRYSLYGVLKIHHKEEIQQDILLVGGIKKKLESQFKQPMNISIAYAQNAHIKASGDLIITGQGCLNSNVFVGGSVMMENTELPSAPCVFRGGEIRCTKDIHLSEIGSTGGAYTKVQTERQGKILFNTLYFNTEIQIGESVKKVEETYQRGICFRNHKGDIIIHST